MMDSHYTTEKNTRILIALMKFHGIRRVVASPGTTNTAFVASLQSDPWFEMYSSVDERSAAYIACGLAAESGEPVALSCTGSTASRNYYPGLTEAFYRKLPVLAVTSSQPIGRVGSYRQQVIDRSARANDIAVESVHVGCINTPEEEWACGVAINKALIALRRRGGGPAHINLETTYGSDYSVKLLPKVRGIRCVEYGDKMPPIDGYKRIAVLVGAHAPWSDGLLASVEAFCRSRNAVVLHSHASNYKGEFGVNHALVLNTKGYRSPLFNADLVVYIGSVARYPSGMSSSSCEMWRVSPDGEVRDPEQMLSCVFAMREDDFFSHYADEGVVENTEYAHAWQAERAGIADRAPEVPFSNVFVAKCIIGRLPEGCVLHLAGSNTARAWNLFEFPRGVDCYSNDGAMGIDGQVSALIGESLASPERLHFGVVGDLTFFYDMNSIGNRHVGPNLRLLVVNNGNGFEFRIYSNPAHQFGEEADVYIAAGGHYGAKSPDLLRHYAQDLGFEYLCATSKEDLPVALDRFLEPDLTERPMLFEVFTDTADENEAMYAMNHIVSNTTGAIKEVVRGAVKAVAGDKGMAAVKKMIGR